MSKQHMDCSKTIKDSLVGKPVLIRLNTVAPKPITWLWRGRIAIGKLTMLSGDPGLGKSLLTIDLSARVSMGARWPDSSDYTPLGGVVMLSAEDDAADTIRPRLDAAGADCLRISLLTGISHYDPDEKERFLATFNLSRDLGALEQAIGSTPDCRLVVIDPISAFCGATDSHKNADVRGLLAPLSELAQRRQVAVIGVNHLTKSAVGVPAMYRTMGSLAFVAAARAAWAVVKDKQDPSKRLFLPIKNNLAADIAGLSYSIVENNGHPCLAWSLDPVIMSVDEAMATNPDSRDAERRRAKEWLQSALADGPLAVKEIAQQANKSGMKWATIRRAKDDLKIHAHREGFGPGAVWHWRLPFPQESGDFPIDAIDAHIPEVSAYDESEHLCNDLNYLPLETTAENEEGDAW